MNDFLCAPANHCMEMVRWKMIRNAAGELCWAGLWSQYFISHDKELRMPIEDWMSLKGFQ